MGKKVIHRNEDYFLVGPPAVGKSTKVRSMQKKNPEVVKIAEKNYFLFDRDKLRQLNDWQKLAKRPKNIASGHFRLGNRRLMMDGAKWDEFNGTIKQMVKKVPDVKKRRIVFLIPTKKTHKARLFKRFNTGFKPTRDGAGLNREEALKRLKKTKWFYGAREYYQTMYKAMKQRGMNVAVTRN